MSHYYKESKVKLRIKPLNYEKLKSPETYFPLHRNFHQSIKLKERFDPIRTNLTENLTSLLRSPGTDSLSSLDSSSSKVQFNSRNTIHKSENRVLSTGNKNHNSSSVLKKELKQMSHNVMQNINFLSTSSTQTIDGNSMRAKLVIKNDICGNFIRRLPSTSKKKSFTSSINMSNIKGNHGYTSPSFHMLESPSNEKKGVFGKCEAFSLQKIPNYSLYTKIGNQIENQNKFKVIKMSKSKYPSNLTEIGSYVSSNSNNNSNSHMLLNKNKHSAEKFQSINNYTNSNLSNLNVSRGAYGISRNENQLYKKEVNKRKKNSILKLSIEKSLNFGSTFRGSTIISSENGLPIMSILNSSGICLQNLYSPVNKLKGDMLRKRDIVTEKESLLRNLGLFKKFRTVKIFKLWNAFTRRINFIERRSTLRRHLISHPALGVSTANHFEVMRKMNLISNISQNVWNKNSLIDEIPVIFKNYKNHNHNNNNNRTAVSFVFKLVESKWDNAWSEDLKSQIEQMTKILDKLKLIEKGEKSPKHIFAINQKNINSNTSGHNLKKINTTISSELTLSITNKFHSIIQVVLCSNFLSIFEHFIKFCGKYLNSAPINIELYVLGENNSEIKQNPLIEEILSSAESGMNLVISEYSKIISTIDFTSGIGNLFYNKSLSLLSKKKSYYIDSLGNILENANKNEKIMFIREQYQQLINGSALFIQSFESNSIIGVEMLTDLQNFISSVPMLNIEDSIECSNSRIFYKTSGLKTMLRNIKADIVKKIQAKVNEYVKYHYENLVSSINGITEHIPISSSSYSQFISIKGKATYVMLHYQTLVKFLTVVEDSLCKDRKIVREALISKYNDFLLLFSQCEKKYLANFSISSIESDLAKIEGHSADIVHLLHDNPYLVSDPNWTAITEIQEEIEITLENVLLFFHVDYVHNGNIEDIRRNDILLIKLLSIGNGNFRENHKPLIQKIQSLCKQITDIENFKNRFINANAMVSKVLANLNEVERIMRTLPNKTILRISKLYDTMYDVFSEMIKLEQDIFLDEKSLITHFACQRKEIFNKISAFVISFIEVKYNVDDISVKKLHKDSAEQKNEEVLLNLIQNFYKINLVNRVILKSLHKAFAEVDVKERNLTELVKFTTILEKQFMKRKSKKHLLKETLQDFIELENVESVSLFEKAISHIQSFLALVKEFGEQREIIQLLDSSCDFNEYSACNEIFSSLDSYRNFNYNFNFQKDSVVLDLISFLESQIVVISKYLQMKNDYYVNILEIYPKIYYLNEKDLKILFHCHSWEDLTYLYSQMNSNFQLVINDIHLNSQKSFSIEGLNSGGTNREVLLLINPIQVEQVNMNAITIFNKIDTEIASTLESNLVTALNSFIKKEFLEWSLSFNSQLIICTLNLIFTNEINQKLIAFSETTCTSNSKSVKKNFAGEYENLLEKYSQWMGEMNQFQFKYKFQYRTIGSKKQSRSYCYDYTSNLTNVVMTLINHMNIIESLIKNKVTETESYDWMKHIRHLWDSNKKEVIVECGGWSMYQLNNYIGNYERIILSPQTEKIFLFIASCFREKSASFLKINSGSRGYYEIFRELSSLLCVNVISIYIDPVFEMKKIKEMFDIATLCRNWIFLENIDDISYTNSNHTRNFDPLIYISKIMQVIQQEIILNEIKQNNSTMKNFCLMGCIQISQNVKINEYYLKSSSRLMNFIKPDISFYIHNIFGFIGISYLDKTSHHIINIITSVYTKVEKIIMGKFPQFSYDFYFFSKMKTYLTRIMDKCVNYTHVRKEIAQMSCKYLCMAMKWTKFSNEEIMHSIWEYVKSEDVITEDDVSEFIFQHASKKRIAQFLESSGRLYNEDIVTGISNMAAMFEEYDKKNTYTYIPLIIGNGKSSFISLFLEYIAKCVSKKLNTFFIHEYEIMKFNAFSQFHIQERLNTIAIIDMHSEYHMISLPSIAPFSIVKSNSIKDFTLHDITSYSLFTITPVKYKKLLKLFINNAIIRLQSMNVIINDEYSLSIFEFILKIFLGIHEQDSYKRSEIELYFKIVEMNIWINHLIELYSRKMPIDYNKRTLLCNIVIISLLILFSQYGVDSAVYKNLLSLLVTQANAILKQEIAQDFLCICQDNNLENLSTCIGIDINSLNFRLYDSQTTLRKVIYDHGSIFIYTPQYVINDSIVEIINSLQEPLLVIGHHSTGKTQYIRFIQDKKPHIIYIDDLHLKFENFLYFDYLVHKKSDHHSTIIGEFSLAHGCLTPNRGNFHKYSKIVFRNSSSMVASIYKTLISDFLSTKITTGNVNVTSSVSSNSNADKKALKNINLENDVIYSQELLRGFLISTDNDLVNEKTRNLNLNHIPSLEFFMKFAEQNHSRLNLPTINLMLYFSFYQQMKNEGRDFLERCFQCFTSWMNNSEYYAIAKKKVDKLEYPVDVKQSNMRDVIPLAILTAVGQCLVLLCDKLLIMLIIQQLKENSSDVHIVSSHVQLCSTTANAEKRIVVTKINHKNKEKFIYDYDFNKHHSGCVHVYHFTNEDDVKDISSLNSTLKHFNGIFINLLGNNFINVDDLYEEYFKLYYSKIEQSFDINRIRQYNIKSRAIVLFLYYNVQLNCVIADKQRKMRGKMAKYMSLNPQDSCKLSNLLNYDDVEIPSSIPCVDIIGISQLLFQYIEKKKVGGMGITININISEALDTIIETILLDFNSQSNYFLFCLLNSENNITGKCKFLYKILMDSNKIKISKFKSFEMAITRQISCTIASTSPDDLITTYHQLSFLKWNKVHKKVQMLSINNSTNNTSIMIPHPQIIRNLTSLVQSSLFHYRLITHGKEYMNSEYFYLKEFISAHQEKASLKSDFFINSILEKIYLSLNNKFLLSVLLTLEMMTASLEMTLGEKEYVISAISSNFDVRKENSIRPVNVERNEKEIYHQGTTLLEFYRMANQEESESESDTVQFSFSKQFITLIEDSLNQIGKSNNVKYYFKSQLGYIKKDSEKLLYYLAFIEDQSPSIFKYLINKFLRPIYSIETFKINNILKKKSNIPFAIKGEPSINIINFLCSLAAYYEIEFLVIRDLHFQQAYNNHTVFNYKSIIDDQISQTIIEGIKSPVWILVSTEIDELGIMKIITLLDDNITSLHNNFKIFIDLNLVNEDNAKEIIENRTQILHVESRSVDDLEAAHDVWVNVLEENILSGKKYIIYIVLIETMMDDSQKDFLILDSTGKNHDISSITITQGNYGEECSEIKEWKLLDNH